MNDRHKGRMTDEVIQMALSRVGLYRLFSRLFRYEIDDELFDKLQSPPLRETLESLGLQLPLDTDNHELLQTLAEEYTWLFVGPGKHLPPYASVQKKPGAGLLNGPETAAVRRFIKGTGFKFNDSFKDYPDHISAEFEYMETLVQREHDALISDDIVEAEHSRTIQKNLFEEHMDIWIPQYCELVLDNAKHSFYQQLAVSTSKFLALERDLLIQTTT
ncbi:MAG: molecular chaperone TorD family protein [Gammaproteobacteria bacterium]|nr:MAG: molecular chaperone TorD family protein [Gammaproteobacteria bacterium]